MCQKDGGSCIYHGSKIDSTCLRMLYPLHHICYVCIICSHTYLERCSYVQNHMRLTDYTADETFDDLQKLHLANYTRCMVVM